METVLKMSLLDQCFRESFRDFKLKSRYTSENPGVIDPKVLPGKEAGLVFHALDFFLLLLQGLLV